MKTKTKLIFLTLIVLFPALVGFNTFEGIPISETRTFGGVKIVASDIDTEPTHWMSFVHDQTDGEIATGTGAIRLVPAGVSGTGVVRVDGNGIGGGGGKAFMYASVSPSNTQPVLLPRSGDWNTGIGSAGTDDISVVAGGTAMFRATATQLSFFDVTPVSRAAAYSTSNVSSDRSFDADSTDTAELADVLGTLIADIQAYGLLQ